MADRPGHDRRYAIDNAKIKRDLGWEPAIRFEEGLAQTIKWYKDHQPWVDAIKSGAYRQYYQRQYGEMK